MFTHEGHLYTKDLVLPDSATAKPDGKGAMPTSSPHMPVNSRRSLLQTANGSALNPILECEGCPATDTRVPVEDSTQYPWSAVGMVVTTSQSQPGSGTNRQEIVKQHITRAAVWCWG
ncbi:hypothetical protein ABBQ32_000089 [Trebouxia sp. C0010 RCD-2024]